MPTRPRTSVRKSPNQERSRATVEAILGATARVLCREGYDRASTNRVAETAGVSIGSLYQYFPSKEALVAALIDRHTEEMLQVIEAQLAELGEASLERAVREIVRAIFAAHAIDPGLHKVLFEQVPRVGRLGRINEVERRAGALVLGYLSKTRAKTPAALRPADLELASFVLVHTVESLTHAAVFERPELLGGDRLLDETVTLVLRYLVA